MCVKMHKIIVLPAFFYGCDTCSLTLRRGHRKDMGRMPTIIFEPKRDESQEAGKNSQRGGA